MAGRITCRSKDHENRRLLKYEPADGSLPVARSLRRFVKETFDEERYVRYSGNEVVRCCRIAGIWRAAAGDRRVEGGK
jgi:hypothetical protein